MPALVALDATTGVSSRTATAWALFAALAGSHAAAAFFAPAAFAPAVAGSVYLPLMPLQAAGVPVFAAAQSGGWPAPSLLGWAVVLVVWFAIWWAAAHFLSRLFSKLAGRPRP